MAKKQRKKQRGNGRGSVYYDRAKQLWYAAVTRPDGKREKRSAETRDRAELELVRLLAAVVTPELLVADRMTVEQWMTRWLAATKLRIEAGTFAMYERIVTREVIPALGRHKLAALRTVHVQIWLDALAARGLSKATLATHRAVLSTALRDAVRQEMIDRNPAELAQVRGGAVKRQRRALDETAVRRLLTACAQRDRALFEMVVVMIALGLRRGELVALRASRIDLDRRAITIDGQILSEPGGSTYVERTKTKRPRVVTAPDVICQLLAERIALTNQQRAEHPEWPASDYVWLDRQGGYVHPQTFGALFSAVAKEAGITVMLHELRHTAASLYVALGVPDTQVRDILGHTSIAMTARYSHALPETAAKSADAMGGLIERLTE